MPIQKFRVLASEDPEIYTSKCTGSSSIHINLRLKNGDKWGYSIFSDTPQNHTVFLAKKHYMIRLFYLADSHDVSIILWICQKSCTSMVQTPFNNGIKRLSTGAGFLPSTTQLLMVPRFPEVPIVEQSQLQLPFVAWQGQICQPFLGGKVACKMRISPTKRRISSTMIKD